HRNGQMGIGTYDTDGLIVSNNDLSGNNTAGFDWMWEAGGTKFSWSRSLIVRHNYSHHNHGNGLWTDTDNINVLYENNIVSDNEGDGIYHEISYDAVIRNNLVERNREHGIMADSSPNVQMYGNTVRDNKQPQQILGRQARSVTSAGRYGPFLLQNFYVHDNRVAG